MNENSGEKKKLSRSRSHLDGIVKRAGKEDRGRSRGGLGGDLRGAPRAAAYRPAGDTPPTCGQLEGGKPAARRVLRPLECLQRTIRATMLLRGRPIDRSVPLRRMRHTHTRTHTHTHTAKKKRQDGRSVTSLGRSGKRRGSMCPESRQCYCCCIGRGKIRFGRLIRHFAVGRKFVFRRRGHQRTSPHEMS